MFYHIESAPFDLPLEFPFRFRLEGRRSDEPITKMQVHNALEIGYCRHGSGTFFVGSKILTFQSGDMTVITDREVHRCQSVKGTESLWSWFFFQPLPLLVPHITRELAFHPEHYSGPTFNNVLSGAQHPELIAIVKEMIEEASRPSVDRHQALRALVLLLLIRLHRCYGYENTEEMPATHDDLERICPALDYIGRHYDETIEIPELANLCGMSLRNFQLIFARAMRQSPREYVTHCRVRVAVASLTGTDRSISEIAFACGFQSLSSFNRSFRRIVGHAPRDERKRH